MDSLTVITPTGDRPAAFALCERWMSRQDRQPDEWIVVDDGEIPTICTRGQTYLRRKRGTDEPVHTLPLNLLAALGVVATELLVIVEDDDWYSPIYLETVWRRLQRSALVGEGAAVYYHLGYPGWLFMQNCKHASLSTTAVRDEGIEALLKACQQVNNPSVDLRLWRSIPGKVYVSERPICVQFKGMPGRPGVLPWHKSYVSYTLDVNLRKLREWLGADAEVVSKLVGRCDAGA